MENFVFLSVEVPKASIDRNKCRPVPAVARHSCGLLGHWSGQQAHGARRLLLAVGKEGASAPGYLEFLQSLPLCPKRHWKLRPGTAQGPSLRVIGVGFPWDAEPAAGPAVEQPGCKPAPMWDAGVSGEA